MKKKTKLTIGTWIVFFVAATFAYTQPPQIPKQPPPSDLPPIRLANTAQITKTITKAQQVVAKSQEGQLKRNQLLQQYGQKTITKKGKQIVTTRDPVPANELKLLKPMVPILTPQHLNTVMGELISIQQNLNNYLINQQVNMTQQMLNQLNPQTATQTLTQINQTIADLSGVSSVVDVVSGFFSSFGW